MRAIPSGDYSQRHACVLPSSYIPAALSRHSFHIAHVTNTTVALVLHECGIDLFEL